MVARLVRVILWFCERKRGPVAWSDSVNTKGWRALSGASFLLALLQSICTAVLTISGLRVAIGLSALAAASGVYAPARGWHQDAIRIPMLWIATIGALLNLAVLAWIWYLRSRPSAQWRRRELSVKEKRSEGLQVALAILTLLLVGLEVWTHPMVHRPGHAPSAQSPHADSRRPSPSPSELPVKEKVQHAA